MAVLVGTLGGQGYAGPTTACTTGTSGALVPQLADFAVNQGLESYTSTAGSFTGRLVRGKETLVRPYFVLPSRA